MRIQEGRKKYELLDDVFESHADRIFSFLAMNVQ